MKNFLNLNLVLLSAICIIVADSLIKKVSADSSFTTAIKSPWTLLVYSLYLVQIFLTVLIFNKGEMAIYTNLFIVFYGIAGIVSGVLFFNETLTITQAIGIGLGLIGALLMNV